MSVQAVTNTLDATAGSARSQRSTSGIRLADERRHQEVHRQRDPEHRGQQRLAVQQIAGRLRRCPARPRCHTRPPAPSGECCAPARG